MTDEEYQQLERLLGKLVTELGRPRSCVWPYYMQDCPAIATYNTQGVPEHWMMSYDLKSCVERIRAMQPPKHP